MAQSTKVTAKKNAIYGIIILLLGICLATGTQFIFHACGMHEDGSYGRCHYAQLVIVCIGLLMAVGALCTIFWQTREVMLAVSVITACEAVLTLLIPGTIIPLCMMATMSCLAKMKPFTTVMSIVILIVSVVGFVLALSRKEN
ncbi:MAG: DUF4418 family protein [Lachnospiraceae bacterium]|nr:DUF4418 family protein [Lachnospiraceae bacterium]